MHLSVPKFVRMVGLDYFVWGMDGCEQMAACDAMERPFTSSLSSGSPSGTCLLGDSLI